MLNFEVFLPSISLECRKPQFHYVVWSPEGQNWAKIESALNVVMIHLHAKFQAIPSMCSPQNARRPQLHFLHTIGLKLGQYWRKSNYFWKWSGYIIMPPFRPFLPCILFRMPRNPNFTKFVGHQRAKIGPVLAKIESFLEVVSLSMPYFLPFLLCVLLRMLRNVTGPTNRCT